MFWVNLRCGVSIHLNLSTIYMHIHTLGPLARWQDTCIWYPTIRYETTSLTFTKDLAAGNFSELIVFPAIIPYGTCWFSKEYLSFQTTQRLDWDYIRNYLTLYNRRLQSPMMDHNDICLCFYKCPTQIWARCLLYRSWTSCIPYIYLRCHGGFRIRLACESYEASYLLDPKQSTSLVLGMFE